MTQPISSKIVKTQVDNITKNTLRHILSNRFLRCFKNATLKKITAHWKNITTNNKVSESVKKYLVTLKIGY